MATSSMSLSGTTASIAATSSSRSGFSSKKYPGKDALLLHGGCNAWDGASKRSFPMGSICYAAKKGIGAAEVEASLGERRRSKPKSSQKNVVSVGIFKFPSELVPQSLRSLLINPDVEVEEHKEEEDIDADIEDAVYKANWVERILELQAQWKEQKQLQKNNEGSFGDDGNGVEEEEDGCCEVDYEDEEIGGFDFEGNNEEMDGERFPRLLSRVSWSDTWLFAKLAFLSNMAYAIPELKTKDLRRYYGLELVTSSLDRKAEAAAIKNKLDQDSTSLPTETAVKSTAEQEMDQSEQKKHNLPRLSAAYEIAASASSYVQCKAKGLLAFASEPIDDDDDDASSEAIIEGQGQRRVEAKEEGTPPLKYNSRMAARVAASTMTTVVAANEMRKQEAARDLQSLKSSPCEWFICDDPTVYTRCFIIQGSDSLASWQTNLFFEPTKFEETDVLVHRGIYEAAKGIYEQFIPEIYLHLERYGNRAKFQFAGHSLGGSLSLLIHLMLIARGFLKPSTLLPVVTFGSPFVFCGGQRVLQELGLNEDHVHCVMMHRDIVPRAFSCNYPNRVAQLLKRLNGTFQLHPCLNKNHMLYTPMGKIFILQPDEKLSPGHPFLPPGSGIYSLENTHCRPTIASAIRAFLNNPHPLDTLSDLTAYGSEGTILRDHDSNNYLKAMNEVVREHKKHVFNKAREENLPWPLLTSQSPHAWSHDRTLKEIMSS